MKAIFIVPCPHETFLPPMDDTVDADGNIIKGIAYIENGIRKGGWCIQPGEAPNYEIVLTEVPDPFDPTKTIMQKTRVETSVLIQIESTSDFLDEMAANPLYLFVGNVAETNPEVLPSNPEVIYPEGEVLLG